MRFFLLSLVMFFSVGLNAQLNQPARFHKPAYAIDSLFKKAPALKTTQPSIFERAQQTTALCNSTCTPLPVKFLSLKAERKDEEKVTVLWETTNEINAAGYEVQRSLGDAMHFEKVGFMAASGNNSSFTNYLFNDGNNFGGTSYYRLKQLDTDNKYIYSKTVAVKGFSKTEALEVFPNPAQDVLQLTISLTKSGTSTLMVFDATGRMVKQQKTVFAKGSNVYTLDIKSLSPGTYFVRTATPSEKFLSLQFIKN